MGYCSCKVLFLHTEGGQKEGRWGVTPSVTGRTSQH